MGRRYAQINIEKRVKQGFGQGRGRGYKPWLIAQSFSSLGYTTRVQGWKTGREHHLMSDLELNCFFTFDFSPRVLDVREQFPLLPVDETLAIADALGIRHPVDLKTKRPIVLTTDFLVTIRAEPRDVDVARTVKPASALQSVRTLEKLQIERSYWKTRNIEWAIITDLEIPQTLVRNLRWLHPYVEMPQMPALPENCANKVDSMLRESLESGQSLAAGAQSCDDRLGLEPGTSLALARHFIASRRWNVNLNERIDPTLPLKIASDVLSPM